MADAIPLRAPCEVRRSRKAAKAYNDTYEALLRCVLVKELERELSAQDWKVQ